MSLDAKSRELIRYFRIIKQETLGLDKSNPEICNILNPQEAHILLILGTEGPSTMGSIAQSLQLSLSSISGIVDKLEDRKFVRRDRSHEDRRVVRVVLSPEGKKISDLVEEGHLRMTRNILQPLNVEEQDLLLDLFKRVTERLLAKSTVV